MAEVQKVECCLPDQQRKDQRISAGSTSGRHENRVEYVRERANSAECRGDRDDRQYQGKRQITKLLPRVCSVEARRLVLLGRDRKDRSEQQKEHKRRRLPCVSGGDRGERELGQPRG